MRLPSALGPTLCLVLLLGACTGADDDAGPDQVAEELATALGAHDLGEVPLTDDADRATHADLVEPLDAVPVEVVVEEVSEGEGTAEATLAWTWDLGGEGWSYTTTAALAEREGAWRVDWSPSLVEPSLRAGDRLGISSVPAPRGDVRGQGRSPIVVERPVVRYGVDKAALGPRQEARSARAVAAAVGVDVAPYVAQVEAAGAEAFVEAIVLRAEEAATLVPASYGEIPGALAVQDRIPLAPTRDFAAPLLGRVGPATAELVEESDGAIEAGDVVGLSGLQARYDEQLRGADGVEVVAARGEGEEAESRTLFTLEPREGENLDTTLIPTLQSRAEEVLARLGTDGPVAALVAVRPSDGHVLAAANGPGNEGLNAATAGQFAPGSTFKVVTALALLRAGVRPEDVLACPDTIDVDGRDFENYDDYPPADVGEVTLRTAFASSCNTAFIGARDRIGPQELTEAAAALGLGVDHDLGFPAYFGQVPAPDGETGEAAALIGQGTVLAGPLVMATVAASVAAGRTVLPELLPDHEVDQENPEEPLTEEEATTLRALMRAVVTDGSGAFLADLPGEVGAKTGTAEYGTPGPDGSLPTHAWMIATQGDLAVAVFVETGESGSATAGPLLEAFLR